MRIEIDLREAATDTQYDFWQSVTPSAYRVGRVANGNGLSVVASLWQLDGIAASRFSSGAHKIERDSKSVRRHGSRFVKLRYYHAGTGQLDGGSGVHRLGTGAIHVIDQSRPWVARYERTDQTSIFIPHGLIGYDPTAHPVVRTFDQSRLEGRLLIEVVRELCEALEGGATDMPDVFSVLESALHGTTGTVRFRAARDRAMRFFVRRAAVDGRVSADQLGRAFGVSRATVYRAFQKRGGLARYVQNVRLDRTHDLLAGREAARGEIGRIASAFGFCSTSHFSDAFLDRFGVRPSEAARLIRAETPFAAAPVNDPLNLEDTLRHARTFYAGMTG